MAILMLANRIPFHVTNQRQAHWQQFFPAPVAGKTLLIVGVGAMGGAAAARAKRLGLRVLGSRHSGRPHPHVDRMFRPDTLGRLLLLRWTSCSSLRRSRPRRAASSAAGSSI